MVLQSQQPQFEYLSKLVKYRIQEVQYFKDIYYDIILNFTNLQSQKGIIFLKYYQYLGIKYSNRIAEEEQNVDLWFLFQANLISLIQENAKAQIYLVANYY
ncbi:Hypothetical_protein [Hexamita inflata]|uniref:Hypothetical_protein n=1 Tax=Hexamita inflata TaxID=28002 RepID=A0AA86QXB0_9EUKA|nr:Hypothetical protein HINF_LOCUS55414 [Hexamita inflata]